MDKKSGCYAVRESVSRGRVFAEKKHPYRSEFERDRDRVIHSSAFRRLEGKRQVFSRGLNDHYRSRMTHSIEVAQIGRTIASVLGLNESLTEAVCLAHDLGHSPFGHAGEKVFDDLMKEFGGFEHNRQTMRVVDLLEHPYPGFAGLNLMYETRLSLARHKTSYDESGDELFGEVNCPLEGQVANIADRIAYNCHDLEDGMRAGVLAFEQLREVRIFVEAEEVIKAEKISDADVRRTRGAKAIMDALVGNCIEASKSKIERRGVKSVQEVCGSKEDLIVLSADSEKKLAELEKFLFAGLYRHKSILQTATDVEAVLSKLFERFCRKPELMPSYYQQIADGQGVQRAVCDYVSGMTDRYCMQMLEAVAE